MVKDLSFSSNITLDGLTVSYADPPKYTSGKSNTFGISAQEYRDKVVMGTIAAARQWSTYPHQYRLSKRNGELILQGQYWWTKGLESGHEWRDIPTEILD